MFMLDWIPSFDILLFSSLEYWFALKHAICLPCFNINPSYLKKLLPSITDLINDKIIPALLMSHLGHETGSSRVWFYPVWEKWSKIDRLTCLWKCLCLCDNIQISFPQLSHFNSGIIMLLCFTRLSLRWFTNCFEGGKCCCDSERVIVASL